MKDLFKKLMGGQYENSVLDKAKAERMKLDAQDQSRKEATDKAREQDPRAAALYKLKQSQDSEYESAKKMTAEANAAMGVKDPNQSQEEYDLQQAKKEELKKLKRGY
jgi:hypothetical protein